MRTNPTSLRDLLGAAVLHVRSGRATSRSSLAVALGIAPSTVGLYVDHLIGGGYVDESGLVQGPTGRPKRVLATLSDAGWFAGVEFNAARAQAVRVDFSGKRVTAHVKTLSSEPDPRTVMQAIKSAVASLAGIAPGPLLGIGVGAPGIVNSKTGVSSHYAVIPDWNAVPIVETMRAHFDVPITVENNLRAIALAERWFGGGRDLDDYVILGPRSGFGIAIVHGGRPMNGAHYAAGEIGRWPWPLGGKATGRELQDALSSAAVWRRLAGVSARTRLPDELHRALAGYATATGAVWDEIISDFGQVIGCLQLLVDTNVFFLHGPLTALGERFCRSVEQAARATTPALADVPLTILPSSLGDDAGALGAASLAMEAWVPGASPGALPP